MKRPAPQSEQPGTWRRTLLWLVELKGSPRQISLGLALGVLVGVSPTMGTQMLIAAALATLLGVNRAAAIAGVWVTNPFTFIPLYTLTYHVGHAFVPGRHSDSIRGQLLGFLRRENAAWYDLPGQVRELARLGEDLLVPMTVGGLIVGAAAGTVTYVLCRIVLRLLGRRSERRGDLPGAPGRGTCAQQREVEAEDGG